MWATRKIPTCLNFKNNVHSQAKHAYVNLLITVCEERERERDPSPDMPKSTHRLSTFYPSNSIKKLKSSTLVHNGLSLDTYMHILEGFLKD